MERSCTSLPPNSESACHASPWPAWWTDAASTGWQLPAQVISLSFVLVAPLAISTPYFPHIATPMKFFFLPKSSSHQEGQGRCFAKLWPRRSQNVHMYHIVFLYWASLFSVLIPTTHPQLCIWDSHMTHGRSNKMIHPSRQKTYARCFTNQKITWAEQSRQRESCVPTRWEQPEKSVQIKGNKTDCLLTTGFWHQVSHQVNKLSPQLLTTECQESV